MKGYKYIQMKDALGREHAQKNGQRCQCAESLLQEPAHTSWKVEEDAYKVRGTGLELK